MSGFEHIKIVRTKNDIIWLNIDSQDNKHNALTPELLKELKEVIISLKGKGFKGLVISSDKADNFIAGTDLSILLTLTSEKKADIFTSLGNQLCRHIKNLDCTTVALISGNCCNAGLDIALSCDIRICSDAQNTQFSYDDIKQGHYAGFGGISHLIKQKGLSNALDILSHKKYLAAEALTVGLVDYIVPAHKTHQAAEYLIKEANEETVKKPTFHFKNGTNNTLLPNQLNAYLTARKYYKKAQSSSERAAIESIIKTWKTFNTTPDAPHDEASSAAKLLVSEATQHHLKLQKLTQQLDQNITASNPKNQHVHILGCGVMGRYITRLCAENGFLVSLYDSRHSALEKLLPELHQYLDQHYAHHPEQRQAILDKIIIDIDNTGLSNADFIIEATPEDKHAKASLLRDIDQRVKPSALILTSTACLPLDEISKDMQTPQRLAVFNPYNPLFNSNIAEISFHHKSTDHDKLKSFVKALQLKPIQVKSKAGYLGTRLLMTYLSESMLIHQSGISAHAIDTQTASIGMAHAPFDLIDNIGTKECLTVAEALADRLGYDVPSILMQKNEQGFKGKKSGAGFHRYKKGKKHHALFDKTLNTPSWKTKSQEVEKRLMEKMVNEARACLQEEVIDKQALIDLVAIIITGFPVEKGGPLSYLEQLQSPQNT